MIGHPPIRVRLTFTFVFAPDLTHQATTPEEAQRVIKTVRELRPDLTRVRAELYHRITGERLGDNRWYPLALDTEQSPA